MEAKKVVLLGLNCHRDARGGLISSDDSGKEVIGMQVGQSFSKRESRRKHDDTKVNGTGVVRIVELDRMRGGTVRERRIAWKSSNPLSNDGGAAGRAYALDHSVDRRGGFGAGTTDGDAEVIEQEVTRAIEDLGGKIRGLKGEEKVH